MTATPFSAEVAHDDVLQAPVVVLRYDDREPERCLRATVAPTLGSNLAQLRVGDHDVFWCDRQALAAGEWTGCFVLWPLPNRHERDGQKAHEFDGRAVSLDDIVRKDDDVYLIHGLVDDFARATTSIECAPGSPMYRHFPWHSRLELTFTLRADRVEVGYAARNLDERTMPSVFALHPYYALPGGTSAARVRIPANDRMPADEALLPSGELIPVDASAHDLRTPTPIAGLWFHDVWTTLERGAQTFIEFDSPPLRVRPDVSDDFTHVVLYTQKAEELCFVCLEPQTGSTNAINLHDQALRTGDASLDRASHLLTVAPGGTSRGTAAFVVEHL